MKPQHKSTFTLLAMAVAVAAGMLYWPDVPDGPPRTIPQSLALERVSPPLPAHAALEAAQRELAIDPQPMPWGAPVGTRIRFSFEAKSLTALEARDGSQPSEISARIRGTALVHVLARDESSVTLAFAFPEAELTTDPEAADGQPARDSVAGLAAGALVRLDSAGAVRGVRFAEPVNPETRNWLRSLIGAMSFQVRLQEEPWILDEDGVNGPVAATYRWLQPPTGSDGGVLERSSRRDLTSLPGAQGKVIGNHTGLAVATFDATARWLAHAITEEKVIAAIEQLSMNVRMSFSAEFRSIGVEHLPVPSSSGPDGVWDTLDGRATAATLREEREERRLLATVASASVPDLLQQITISLAANDFEAATAVMRLLTAVCRVRPDGLAELHVLLRAGGFPAPVFAAALTAIAGAGTEAAQAVVAEWFVDVTVPTAQRHAALTAVFALRHPTALIADEVARLAIDASDPSLQNVSMLAAGHVASCLPTELREPFAKRLLALREPRAAAGDLYSWFEALGNAGLPETPDWIAPFWNGPDEAARADCLLALRHVATNDAAELLAAAAVDPEPRARQRALEVLADRADRHARGVLLAALGRENEPGMLQHALRGLGSFAGDPDVRAAVLRLQCHPSPEIRTQAAALLRG